MTLTPSMLAALGQSHVRMTGLIKIDLPGHVIRLCDGGFVDWDGERYNCIDDTFGTIDSIDALEDGIGDEAPGGRLTFFPATTAAVVDLSSPEYQGSRIRIWLAVLDPVSGAVIPDPDLLFDGELDITVFNEGLGERSLDMEFVSAAERLFEVQEGARLSDAFHQEIWPGERGLANVTGITKKVYWGGEAPQSGITRSSNYGGGGYGNDLRGNYDLV